MSNLDEMLNEAPSLTFEPFAQTPEEKTRCLRRLRRLRKSPRWF